MKNIQFAELKHIQLSILKDVHNFCIERGLKYSLGGGTLLGAVRHKGYIPWDDDIDIMMPRPDYNIFVNEFSGYKPHLTCGAFENDKKFMYPYAKVYNNRTCLKEEKLNEKYQTFGVNIDLFPIDGFPDKSSRLKFSFFMKKVLFMKKLLFKKIHKPAGKNNFKRKCAGIIVRFISLQFIQKHIKRTIQTCDFKKSNYRGAVIGKYSEKECYPQNVFSEYTELEFEGFKFMAISYYDEYLTGHYGDYMKLPAAEQQVGSHAVKSFWI
ncbi:MAG: LicD family protein [Prevotellaceae bacterium]|jgi:lipopolysaccharide cholinephosphotransferase|nr:LicD family protein [Prevotellaceae bacterium]